MKIFKINSNAGGNEYAILRPDPNQYVGRVDILDVWWDNWGSSGNKIGDFIFCYGQTVCKTEIFNILMNNFNGLAGVPLKINKTTQEINAKNPKRLKWLPKEEIPLTAIHSLKDINCLPQSTVTLSERGIEKMEGVAEIRGDIVIPRETGKGLFFSKKDVSDFDFFRLKNTGYLFCTENVRYFCEKNNYTNTLFLEMGDIVE